MNTLSKEQAFSRERTLLIAFLLSVWGPLATGIAVILSHSTTQLADFVRRTVELVAISTSWWMFRSLQRGENLTPVQKARMEKIAGVTVAIALGCSGAVILSIALSRLYTFEPGGNVYPGLAIASLGLLVNSWFWKRFATQTNEQYSPITDSQRRLYRAKVFVDLCVMAALSAVAFNPVHPLTRYIDVFGSVAVAVYMLWSGVRTARLAMINAKDTH